jgi:cell wall-associated NlpC family hydrolase
VSSLDNYFSRTYNEKTYNCSHFVAEVFRDLSGIDISRELCGFGGEIESREVRLGDLRVFRIGKMQDLAIAIFHGTKNETHAGVVLDGKVLHITARGVFLQPLEVVALSFKRYGFYVVEKEADD